VQEILSEIEQWQQAGERVVVATVIGSRRSAPRPVGSSLAISESGSLCGSVSGGCVEGDVFEQSREVLETGAPLRNLDTWMRRPDASPVQSGQSLSGNPTRSTQFGHTSRRTSSAQAAQKVHSYEQIRASAASGGRSLSHSSQFGRSSSI